MSINSGPAACPKKYPERPAARQRTISFLSLFLFTGLLVAVPPDSYAQVAQAADDLLSERRTALTGKVRTAWWQLISLDRSPEIVNQNQALMRDFVEIAQMKYEVGNGLQQDVLLAQLEFSRLLDRLADLGKLFSWN